MPNTSCSAELLIEGGVFDRQWDSFVARPGQQQMAALVDKAISEKKSLVIEAASGSGKTLAYLVPIINHKKRAVISTASRYLQRQLFNHDIPLAVKILNKKISVALLQGRSHYLCPYYLAKNIKETTQLNKTTVSQLLKIDQRYRESGNGELDSLAPKISAKVRLLVTSGADDCLSTRCPQWTQCPLRFARQRAQQADIVVVNHSLLFVDQIMKQQQFGELLPSSEVVVVDEAHRLTDFAQTLVGDRLSSQQLKRFTSDIKIMIKRYAPEQAQLKDALEQLELGLASLTRRLPSMTEYLPRQFVSIVAQLINSFEGLAKHLDHLQVRHNLLAELAIRNQLLIAKLTRITDQQDLCWIQATTNGFIIQAIPIHLAAAVKPLMNTVHNSWIFTSATLSVSDNPQRFLAELGLENKPFHRLDSDIDYQQHATLFTPVLPVNPDHESYCDYLLDEVMPLLKLVNGRVLFLFSSHRALLAAAVQLQTLCDRPLLVHRSSTSGSDSNHYQLIKAFKQSEQAVLMATGSFWEGVDLSGLPINAVIIDKLPFAMPTDPLVQFRSGELSRHGVDSFEQYILPEAVIRIRQGCGRLLRRISDRGVIMLADPRIHSRAYGRVFIESLPAMQQVFSMTALQQYFKPGDNNSIDEKLNENISA
jgi:ATP-dependent DNA helicase DinG